MNIFGKKTGTTSLNELIIKKITVCESEMKVNTAKKYNQLLGKIEKFYGLVPITAVTPQFTADFKKCMVDNGNCNSTVGSFLTLLRAIFNYAQYKGLVSKEQYPFQKRPWELDRVKIPKPARRTERFLTKQEMNTIYQWFINAKPTRKAAITEKRMVGLFLMSYLSNGANMADLLRLKYSTDYYRSGCRILSFYRHKTQGRSDIKVKIPLTDKLQAVMKEIADQPATNNYVLGSFLYDINPADEVEMTGRVLYWNAYAGRKIKPLFHQLGIAADVSFTYARHSYSTVMHHNSVPFAVVEQNLGHSNSGNVAFSYIGETSIDDLFKYNELLLD